MSVRIIAFKGVLLLLSVFAGGFCAAHPSSFTPVRIQYPANIGNRPANDTVPAREKDVQSIDAIIAALYDVISGPAGQKRDWDRMRSLFVAEGRLIPTGKRADGSTGRRVLSVEDYISTSGPFLEKNGFFEKEIGRKTEVFGSIAHVFSTYDSRKTQADATPFMRGINSIQLWYDGQRWWVVSVFWQSETPELKIPEKYLGTK